MSLSSKGGGYWKVKNTVTEVLNTVRFKEWQVVEGVEQPVVRSTGKILGETDIRVMVTGFRLVNNKEGPSSLRKINDDWIRNLVKLI